MMIDLTALLEELTDLLEKAAPGKRDVGASDRSDYAKARSRMKDRHAPQGGEKSDKKKDKKDKKAEAKKAKVLQFKAKAKDKDKTGKADDMIKGIQSKERDRVTGKGVGDDFVPASVARAKMKEFAGKTGGVPGKHPDSARDGKHYPFKRRSKLGLGPDGKHHYQAGVYPWKCVCAKGGCKGK